MEGRRPGWIRAAAEARQKGKKSILALFSFAAGNPRGGRGKAGKEEGKKKKWEEER